MLNNSLIRKVRTALQRPHLVRNRALGMINYWPTSKLVRNEAYRAIPHYCANMKQSVARRRLVQRQVGSMGLTDFTFTEAVIGANLDIPALIRDGMYDPEAAIRCHGRELSRAELGVSLSHREIFLDIIAKNHQHAVILEDDVLFLSRNIDAFDMSTIPDDYDVLMLHAGLSGDRPEGQINGSVYGDASYEASAVAYMVSHKGVRKLADASLPVLHAPDGLIGRGMPWSGAEPHAFRQIGVPDGFELKVYIVFPFFALNGSTCHFVQSTLPLSHKLLGGRS